MGSDRCDSCGKSDNKCGSYRCDDCGCCKNKCGCKKKSEFGCAFKTGGIIGVILIALIAAGFLSYQGIRNIYDIQAFNGAIFNNPLAVSRAFDYLKAVGTFFWLDMLVVIVPIALLCCIDSMCKNNETRHFWFTRFGLSILFMLLVIVAQAIATLFLSARATHFAGFVLLFAALVGFLGGICLGSSWKMVLQFIIAALAFGLALYLIIISPGSIFIANFGAGAIIP